MSLAVFSFFIRMRKNSSKEKDLNMTGHYQKGSVYGLHDSMLMQVKGRHDLDRSDRFC